MPKRMYANFSDEAYNDLMNGAAVDNNGLRSPKGYFYPDQPSFEPINERREQLQDAVEQMLVAAGQVVIFGIVLPEIKRYAHEKVYPFIAEKWDNWQERRKKQKVQKSVAEIESESTSERKNINNIEATTACLVIDFEDYRRTA